MHRRAVGVNRIGSRVMIAAVLASGVVATSAGAHHLARGSTKRAILESLRFPGRVNSGHNCRTRALPCWKVIISGSNWSTANDFGPGNNGAVEWTYIDHRAHGQWRYVGGWGEGFLFSCRSKGMPARIARDLRIPCK